MQVYTLIYAERMYHSPAAKTVIGPVVAADRQELVDLVFSHVSSRVLEAYCEEICEEFLTQQIETHADIDRALRELPPRARERAVDWYMETMKYDEEVEAFYKIEAHEIPLAGINQENQAVSPFPAVNGVGR